VPGKLPGIRALPSVISRNETAQNTAVHPQKKD